MGLRNKNFLPTRICLFQFLVGYYGDCIKQIPQHLISPEKLNLK